eukprot:CAMPEP_0168550998 /NCGR_PEP_ID=MMETSP0413-20121227/5936_1 /TAXON_ID=136452 /ORGANISM="Filamoeba nolandi, Strain NC-AS-23-1" /LENGTH=724 /DNA_ID=CAMNT_0008581491 /DNA_START=70 /DNA_END=2241 /DNA_ORIENTATION=-
MADYSRAISKLQTTFGNVDKDVLIAVLEVCGGDEKEAIKYLQATDNNSGYDVRQLSSNTGIPKDYPGRTATNHPITTKVKVEKETQEEVNFREKVEKIKGLFINDNVTYQDHFDSQTQSYDLYTTVLLLLINQGVEISKASRSRILASAWARKDQNLAQYLLGKEDLFALPHILGAVALLDSGRKVRALEKKVARLEKQNAKPKKTAQLKAQINDLKREALLGSVSGALCRHVKKWVQSIEADKLEFYALNMPKAPWCELADVVHLGPNDFQVPWFLEYVFGKDAPESSVINICKELSSENIVSTLSKSKIPYSYLRLQVKPIPEEAKPLIANFIPLDTLIWYYEELACSEVDAILEKRLSSGQEKPTFGYGKLMERLLYFKSVSAPFFKHLIPIAEERLSQIDLNLEPPVVVIGDASYSMDVAIRVSTVIASVLTALCGAELKFFTGESVDPPVIPKTASEVLDVATSVKADGLTAPAAALWPYYNQKKVVKFFIVVTDEIENEKYKDYYFPSLFQKYYTEVYPAKIVFVSFLENPSEKGRMVTALENMGITPLQFRLDGKRPDMTKLDSLLGLLASESAGFPQQVKNYQSTFEKGGTQGFFEKFYSVKTRANNNNNNATQTTKQKSKNLTQKTDKKKNKNKNVASKQSDTKVESKESTDSQSNAPAKSESNSSVESKDCVICEERKITTALLECGHLNFCDTCADGLKECPICRQAVIRTVR